MPAAPKAVPAGGHMEACIASGLLAIGCFAPILSLPIVGSMNYVGNGNKDGMFVLVLVAISLFLAFSGRIRGLRWSGGIAGFVILFDLIGGVMRINNVQAEMAESLKDNPFGGIAQAMMSSVQIQWGWVPLIAGAALMIAVGFGLRFPKR